MASLTSRTISKSPLPSRLPVLLIGSGLANLTLARTLQIHGYSDPDLHFRLFDKSNKHARRHQSLNLQSWATDPLEALLLRNKPHFGEQPGFFQSCAVDAHHGGTGYVSTKIGNLKTIKPITDMNEAEGRTVRYKRQELEDMIKGGVNVEHEKEFVRFEEVVDQEGRTAIKAYFKDGTEVLGSAIVAGDGMRSTVRSHLLPTITPTTLPLVVYTGQADLLSRMMIANISVDGVVPAYNKRSPESIDCYSTYVGDNVAFVFSKVFLDWESARIQWVYIRKPKGWVEAENEDGELVLGPGGGEGEETAVVDALFRPERALDEAKVIPEELYQEIEALKKADAINGDLRNFVDDLAEGTGIKKYHWLMRSVRLPSTKEELDGMKQKVVGGEKVFLIGDAAHAAPIVQGYSGSHSIYDGYTLGTLLSKAFRLQSLPSSTPLSSTPSSSPVLNALNDFESTKTLTRWSTDCVTKSETDLMGLVQPQAVWDVIEQAEGNSAGGFTESQKERRKGEERVEDELRDLAEWHKEQGRRTKRESEKREAEKREREQGLAV